MIDHLITDPESAVTLTFKVQRSLQHRQVDIGKCSPSGMSRVSLVQEWEGWFSDLCSLKGQGHDWRISIVYMLLPTSEEFVLAILAGLQTGPPGLACRKAVSPRDHQIQLAPLGLFETSLFGTQSVCPTHTRRALNSPESAR